MLNSTNKEVKKHPGKKLLTLVRFRGHVREATEHRIPSKMPSLELQISFFNVWTRNQAASKVRDELLPVYMALVQCSKPLWAVTEQWSVSIH